MSTPPISVLMCVYNGAQYLHIAVESILNQTFEDFEFIIIDDGSSDSSWEIIQNFHTKDDRIVPIRQKNVGLTKSLNRGLRQAKGNFIARIDADDLSYDSRLEKQFNFLIKNKDYMMVGGQRIIRNLIRNKSYKDDLPITTEDIRKVAPRKNPFFHSLVMIRKDVIKQVGHYNENFMYVQDFELWSRIIHQYKTANLNEVLGEKLINLNNISFRKDISWKRNYCSLMARYKVIKLGNYSPICYRYLLLPLLRLIISYRTLLKKQLCFQPSSG
jgi:glycosyltransferase involved in cell wall biosynthesis